MFDLRDGDCLRGLYASPSDMMGVEVDQIRIVPCTDRWEHKVLNSFVVTGWDAFPDVNTVLIFEWMAMDGCDRRYTDIIYPTKDS